MDAVADGDAGGIDLVRLVAFDAETHERYRARLQLRGLL